MMKKVKVQEVENYKSIKNDILEVIRIHFCTEGPKGSKLDICVVIPDKCFRLNWWEKTNGGKNIVKSLFATIAKGEEEYTISAE